MKISLETMYQMLTGRSDENLPAGFKVYRSSVLNALTTALADELVVTHALLGKEDFRALVAVYLTERDADWDFSNNVSAFTAWLKSQSEFAQMPFLPDLAAFEAKIWQVRTLRGAPEDCAMMHREHSGEVRLWQALYPVVTSSGSETPDLAEVISNSDFGCPPDDEHTHWKISSSRGLVHLEKTSDHTTED